MMCCNKNMKCEGGKCCDGSGSCSCMRGVRIFLFVLIVIGVGLLVTQGLWVAKFSQYLASVFG